MVTIKEIAQAVGVSPATVSRVLNYDTTLSISAKKRKAIIETAEALDYATPRNRNRAAGAGAGASAARVALVNFSSQADEIADPYYIGVRFGIQNRCQAQRIETFTVYDVSESQDRAALQGLTGIIVLGKHEEDEVSWLLSLEVPLVITDVLACPGAFDFVESDLEFAMAQLLDALHGAGYGRIAFIGGKASRHTTAPFGEKRCSAYIAWMESKGLFDPALCLVDAMSFESGYQLAQQVLAEKERPDVIITANDNMAIGAYRAVQELGLSVPNDVGIVGFNDIPAAQFLAPPLSTVRLHAERIGETAVELLLEQIGGRDYFKKVSLSTEMIWRESCRSPK